MGDQVMNKSGGLTAPELLITLCLLSVMAGMSLPSFRSLVDQQKAATAIRDIATALRQARASAVTTAALVTACPSPDGVSCGGQWHEGVMVFTDRNGNHVLDTTDRLLHRVNSLRPPGTLRWRAFRNRNYLQFTGNGFTRYQNGNFTFCHHSDPRQHRQLIVSRTGRLRFTHDSDDDGLRENARGAAIDCD